MAVVARPQSNSKDGPRPININKDIPQILRLLELCFGSAIHGDGRNILTSDSMNQSPAFLWRMTPAAGKLAQGIVWEVNGRIVGNVTLLSTKVPGRFLIVNVAVHPDFRRQQIAKNMMVAVTEQVKRLKGREILLQVVKTNTAANMLLALAEGRLSEPRPTGEFSVDEIGLMMGGNHQEALDVAS